MNARAPQKGSLKHMNGKKEIIMQLPLNIFKKEMCRYGLAMMKHAKVEERGTEEWRLHFTAGLFLLMHLVKDNRHTFTRKHCARYPMFRDSPELLDEAFAFLEQLNMLDWDVRDEAEGGERTYVIVMDRELSLD